MALQQTALRTPVFGSLMRWLARMILRITSWTAVGPKPAMPKYVLLAAPHTSNWDFVYAIAVLYALDMDVYWLGKKELFPFPFRWFMRWLGGIPVDRSRPHHIATQIIHEYRENDELVVLIPPEGTRKRTEELKKGYYLIAKGAQVPIVMGYLDYAAKEGGIGPAIEVSGNYRTDETQLLEFYRDIPGLYPEQSFLNDELVARRAKASEPAS